MCINISNSFLILLHTHFYIILVQLRVYGGGGPGITDFRMTSAAMWTCITENESATMGAKYVISLNYGNETQHRALPCASVPDMIFDS